MHQVNTMIKMLHSLQTYHNKYTNSPKIYAPSPNYNHQRGEMKQVQYWRLTNIMCHHTKFSCMAAWCLGFVHQWLTQQTRNWNCKKKCWIQLERNMSDSSKIWTQNTHLISWPNSLVYSWMASSLGESVDSENYLSTCLENIEGQQLHNPMNVQRSVQHIHPCL